jgi:hypothetical protein
MHDDLGIGRLVEDEKGIRQGRHPPDSWIISADKRMLQSQKRQPLCHLYRGISEHHGGNA